MSDVTGMEWALEIASQHPDLAGAFVHADGEWLEAILPDQRTLRFRPMEMIDFSAAEEKRRVVFHRLLSIAVKMAASSPVEEVGDEETPDEHMDFGPRQRLHLPHRPNEFLSSKNYVDVPDPHDSGVSSDPDQALPIVRAADYFFMSHNYEQSDSIVYVPITEFIGVGLATDTPDTIEPVYYSDLTEREAASPLGSMFASSVTALRQLNMRDRASGLELGVTRVGGAEVYVFAGPTNYESSWFVDVDMARLVSDSLRDEHGGNAVPLFVPATRTHMFVVMDNDPGIVDIFRSLRGLDRHPDVIYPLPHTCAADGWKEWIPFPDHPAAAILSELRALNRSRIYRQQAKMIAQWPTGLGSCKEFSVVRDSHREYVSYTQWSSNDNVGSIPLADYVTFIREPRSLPWESAPRESISVPLSAATSMWDGFTPISGVWPPRYEVHGFPGDDVLERLREVAELEG
ncbi:hypothetical protein I6E29_07335 [Arcanobacterium haemolyticum]|nr:hypothetical protein [Arcanobacterium haemolyticum]